MSSEIPRNIFSRYIFQITSLNENVLACHQFFEMYNVVVYEKPIIK